MSIQFPDRISFWCRLLPVALLAWLILHPHLVQAANEAKTTPGSSASTEGFRDTLKTGGLGPELIVIPSGAFLMGDLQSRGYGFEHPVHEVIIENEFAIGRYEVTFDEFDLFCSLTGRAKLPDEGWGRGRRPVIHVSWSDAVAYCNWLSKQTGRTYRLPTEAEWEYAARANTQTARFWGDDPEMVCLYANAADLLVGEIFSEFELHNCVDGFPFTSPVGEFSPNDYGLYDMLGNVWEWTLDTWHPDYQGAPGNGKVWSGWDPNRVRRGGSWFSIPKSLRCAVRNGAPKGFRGNDTGFRVVREMPLVADIDHAK